MTCDPVKGCPPDTHNLHCGYPECPKGEAERAARRHAVTGWRDIATAPKMRTILLFAVTDVEPEGGRVRNWKMATGFYHTGYEDHERLMPWNWEGRQLERWDVFPTHWHELPEPPA